MSRVNTDKTSTFNTITSLSKSTLHNSNAFGPNEPVFYNSVQDRFDGENSPTNYRHSLLDGGLRDVFKSLPIGSYGKSEGTNTLILGDNLPVMKELLKSIRSSVRCVYLDPPYNNQENYRHFSDTRSHEDWLSFVVERLKIIKQLVSVDGSVWISIDDREAHYLKVAADAIFGRENFITTVVWQQRKTRENRRAFSVNHEYLLVYAADPKIFRLRRNLLSVNSEYLSRYKNPDSDPRGPWQSVSANAQDGHATKSQFYPLIAPNSRIHYPPKGRVWVYTQKKMKKEIQAGRVWFGISGNGVPRLKRYLSDSRLGLTPETIWKADDVGTSDDAKKQLLKLFPDSLLFDTPKPEQLISRIIEIATDPGDLVFDPFLGAGTTAAVAHKMRRRYIGIEINQRLMKLNSERLRLVVDGDQSGCSERVHWSQGGGFDVYGDVV